MGTLVHEAATSGYSRDTDRYHRGRPMYHPALVQRVAERYGQGTVVELGAGTGIFTRQLVDLGVPVIAVEPVVGMRTMLHEAVPEADVRVGAAENIPMDDHTADAVIASQSFHWFDAEPALDEIYRVLRLGGHLVTVWNVRDESVDWVSEVTQIVDRHAGGVPRYRDMTWRRAINADDRFGAVDEWRIDNPQPTDIEGIVDRMLSTSFIAALSRERQDAVAAEIRSVVSGLAPPIEFPYLCQLQAWRALEIDETVPSADEADGDATLKARAADHADHPEAGVSSDN